MLMIILGVIAGAAMGAGLSLLFFRAKQQPALKIEDATVPEPATPQSTEPPAQAAEPQAEPPAESVPTALARIGKELSPLAEEIGHPRELLDMPEFQQAVTVLRRPDATTAQLGEHAVSANWPIACAALVALVERPDRQSQRDAVTRHFPHTRPYVLMYALRFLASLEQRPPVGIVTLAAADWWADNPVVPDLIADYFKRSAELGDKPEFGDALEQGERDSRACDRLLRKVSHPFAAELLAILRRWLETRIDRAFLGTVGTLWDPAENDPLLVVPPSWEEPLTVAEAAVTLARPRSILVCGDALIGKTTLIKLLGERLQRQGWTIFAAGGTELMADQMYIGQLEGRIKKIVAALHARRKVIWYVRDLGQMAHSGTHRGQSATILDQLLPAIAAGNLIVIGESSQAAATRMFQLRPSLRALVEVVLLQPMKAEATSNLAVQVGERITTHVRVNVSDQAIATTMDLAQHYLGSSKLPGVVLELLKRSANRSIAAGETAVTAESVVATLSQISGLPAAILDTNQRVDLAQMHRFFAQRVMGQDEAVKAVVDRIAMLKAGLTDPARPIGVFLFAGPTGTGKTELAKTVAEFLFGAAERMTRLDMSEFQTADSTSKILGQRGEAGGDSLIDRIRKQPFSVVLLDEFEKAHPNCWDLFLQIFDDGRLSDANGREADFRHCIIILTSNLGATAHRGSGLGFRPDASSFADDQVMRTIAQTFRPEFVNRLDKVIVFKPLSRDLMRGILHKELAKIQERRGLRERDWAVEWEASAIEFLLDRGFSPEMGARPLKRAIDQLLLAPLAATLVEHRFPQGDQFLFVRSNGREIEVEFVDPNADPAPTESLEPDVAAGLSLPSIVLSPSGSTTERNSLAAFWREVRDRLAGESWTGTVEQIRLKLADPAIWTSDDRHEVFSKLELADRIQEAARTAERLFQRYTTASGHTARASRELAGRLALQLYNLQQGIADFEAELPVDALLRVEPAMDTGGDVDSAAVWCGRLIDMYRQWAAKRRMQIAELSHRDGGLILHITGFGAFRTLKQEVGLHILEGESSADGARRIVARVVAVAGPERGLPNANPYAAASQALAAAGTSTTVVRRYREDSAPIVRDLTRGWRSGRLTAVLSGDFELIGMAKGPDTVA